MVKSIPTDTVLIVLAILWSILLPSYSDGFFQLFDTVLGVFVLLVAVLLALPYGPIPGVLVFVAVALTFVERNRRKISKKMVLVDSPDLKQQLAPAPPMSTEEVHPAFEIPGMEESPFMPEKTDSDVFEAVGPSINEKMPNPTATPNNDETEKFYIDQHLARTELL
jgi:hypothetical protein